MVQPTLSVILITRNEAAHVAGCLASVAFADEWIVVDSGSTDATCDIARRCGATVVSTEDWPGFGVQKNRALALARGRWVLSIDADERVTPELAARIRRAVDTDASGHESVAPAPAPGGRLAGYEFSRLSNFCGQWMRHGDWYPDRVLRLFRRDAGRFSDDLVHERLIVDGPTGRLDGELLHDSMPTLNSALDKMNRYTSGRALDKVRAGQRGGLAAALSHGVWAFLRCYILRRGLFDGRLGLVLALYVAEGTYYRYLKMGLLARPPRRPFD
jgi:glycosyltransferase involved in cell wall biosynthesis